MSESLFRDRAARLVLEAQAHLQAGRATDAAVTLTKAIQLRPKAFELHVARADILLDLGDTSSALLHMRKAALLSQNTASSSNANDTPRLGSLQAATPLNSHDWVPPNVHEQIRCRVAEILDLRAISFCQRGLYEQAFSSLNEAIKFSPNEPDCTPTLHLHRTIVRMHLGHYLEALSDLDIAAGSNMADSSEASNLTVADFHYLRAKLLLLADRSTVQARSELDEALKIDKKHSAAVELECEMDSVAAKRADEGTRLALLHRWEAAKTLFNQAIQLSPGQIKIRVRFASALRLAGEIEKSISVLEGAIQYTGGVSVDTSQMLSLSYNDVAVDAFANGDFARSSELIELAFRASQPHSPAIVLINRGDTARKLLQIDKARRSYELAIAASDGGTHRSDDHRIACLRLASMLAEDGVRFFNQHRHDVAFSIFSRVVLLAPSVGVYFQHLGEAAMHLARYEVARDNLSVALKLDSSLVRAKELLMRLVPS